jgi:hypothetical protein
MLTNNEFTFAKNEYTEEHLHSIVMKKPRLNRNIKSNTEKVGHEVQIGLLGSLGYE